MAKISWWRTDLGGAELELLTESFRAERMSMGPVTERLEAAAAEAVGVPYAVAATSGSAALLMALMSVGVGRDDEVIMPDRTFIAAAHAAMLLGAKIVLVDTVADIPAMDPDRIEEKVTPRTKAIVPAHLNGRASDMAGIRRAAEKHGLAVVEDACQAVLSRGPEGFLGTLSDAGCYSLGMTKLLQTGQGGLVVTRDKKTRDKLRLIRNHGVVDTMKDSYGTAGFNFKFADLLASLGVVQFSRAKERVEAVRAVYARYEPGLRELKRVRLIPVKTGEGEVPLWVEVLCPERESLMRFLADREIETRKFLPSMHLSAHLDGSGDYPNSMVFHEQGLFLPAGPAQPFENIDRVLEALRDFERES